MATVKILYNDTAERLERYLKNHLEQNKAEGKSVQQTEYLVFLDGITQDFFQVQSDFNTRGNNALHLIQSWSPQESKQLKPQDIHAMGIEMANQFAPGHQYVVQTHTDQAHHHNHIVINPVHLETGKRIQNKLENVRTLREINDSIAKERGLSVLPPQESLKRPGPNEKARRIETYRGKSYIVDLAQKADFARGLATNYDEYVALLGGFNITARIENQNITYFYPGREVGKRGRNLAPELDKPALEKKFAHNRELLALESPRALEPLVSRRFEGLTQPRTEILEQSVIPIEEIQKAKTQSIRNYCQKEKIRMTRNEEGQTVLLNREHVEIGEYSWINHRNKTQGTLIDFVANHRKTSLLHAVSIINENPKLMILEQHLGEVKRGYQSFQIPQDTSAPRGAAIQNIAHFLGHSFSGSQPSGSLENRYSKLFRDQRVQVTSDFKIRFFPEKNTTGFLEYIPDSQGRYQKKVHGVIHTPFVNQKGNGESLALFLEPRSFLKMQTTAFDPDFGKSSDKTEGKLVLLEPNLAVIHQVVATRKNLKSLRLIQAVTEKGEILEPEIAGFFHGLQASLDPFSIDTSLAWESFAAELLSSTKNTSLETSMNFFNL